MAIDVNTGKFIGSESQEETHYQTNLEAAVEIPRQLRLRNLGGIIALDFIDMENASNRKRVLQTLEKGVRKDRARTKIESFTDFGVIEMTRQRQTESLSAMYCAECPYCKGSGHVLSEETVVIQTLRSLKRVASRAQQGSYRLVVSDMIAARLRKEDRQKLRDLMKSMNIRVKVVADRDIHMEDFRVFEMPHNREIFVG